jgi:hypothetical protein
MGDPIQAADAMAALVTAQDAFRKARAARRQAMRGAVGAGAPLRDVAKQAGCSHEAVRRLASSQGLAVLLLAEAEYPLTEEQIEVLIYKLAGAARGAFPKDIELLAAGADWLIPAAELADALNDAQADDEAKPIVLDERLAFALYQVLRLTYTGRPTVLSRLYDDLLGRYGQNGQPHVISELSRNRPRKR